MNENREGIEVADCACTRSPDSVLVSKYSGLLGKRDLIGDQQLLNHFVVTPPVTNL